MVNEAQIGAELDSLLSRLQSRKDAYLSHAATMQSLIKAGEARRLGRTQDIEINWARFNQGRVISEVTGASGYTYETRITLAPKRGHHCTCPDWQKNGRRVGPCKHVLALGRFWLDEKVTPALSNLMENLAYALKG